jgi:hypothetical protein
MKKRKVMGVSFLLADRVPLDVVLAVNCVPFRNVKPFYFLNLSSPSRWAPVEVIASVVSTQANVKVDGGCSR